MTESVNPSGRTIAHIAKDLGIHREALRQWVRQAEADSGSRRDRLTSDERERLKALERENRELREANEILKAASVFFQGARSDAIEVSRFIDEHRGLFGVEPICRTLGVSASAYFQRARGERSARDLEDERLLAVIREAHRVNFEACGYRRMWKALRRAGEHVPRCQVQRLMRHAGIQGAKRRGKPWRTTVPDPDAIRPADLVERDFTAERPDELWLCDFTRLRCWDGVLYFAFVIDVNSRRVVGWQLAPHMRDALVIDALRMALAQRHRPDPRPFNPAVLQGPVELGQYTS